MQKLFLISSLLILSFIFSCSLVADYETQSKKSIEDKILQLATKLTRQRIGKKNRPQKQKRVSFSPYSPKIQTFIKDRPVEVDYSTLESRHGIIRLSITSNNLMSYRYEPFNY